MIRPVCVIAMASLLHPPMHTTRIVVDHRSRAASCSTIVRTCVWPSTRTRTSMPSALSRSSRSSTPAPSSFLHTWPPSPCRVVSHTSTSRRKLLVIQKHICLHCDLSNTDILLLFIFWCWYEVLSAGSPCDPSLLSFIAAKIVIHLLYIYIYIHIECLALSFFVITSVYPCLCHLFPLLPPSRDPVRELQGVCADGGHG